MSEAVVVGVRVRPYNQREKDLGAELCIAMDGPTTTITNLKAEEGDKEKCKPYTFDESFWSHDGFEDDGTGYMKALPSSNYADQRVVFDTFGKRVLDNAWDGFHCCLFAYGQTGAGKSYSMVGYGANKGIVPISCEEIFLRIDKNEQEDKKYEVTVSMVEIYNEAVQDLLINPEARPKKGLEIRESKLLGIYIDGVLKRPVDSYKAIEATIEEATNHRTVGSTLMNATSSRAHTVQTIEFKQIEGNQSKVSMINLVDLAGSEKAGQTGASGDRLKEGAMINKSLSALGNVIEKLAEKSNEKGKKNVIIPYRDSKLTRLLQNALGGSSKTIMICALSPASSNYEETLSTLRYADRAKKIKNNATVNENPQDKLLRELKEENAKLKEMMQRMQSGEGEGPNVQELTEMRDKQQELADAQRHLEEMSKSFEQRLQEHKAKGVDQEGKSRKRGSVCRTSLKKSEVPLLVNLNADPQLTGRIQYALQQGEVMRIGKTHAQAIENDTEDEDEEDEEEPPQIMLLARLVFEKHATILNTGTSVILQCPEEEAADLTFINGATMVELQNISEDTKDGVVLSHGDRIIFGECCFFFAMPMEGDPAIMVASGQVDYNKALQEYRGKQAKRMRTSVKERPFAQKEELYMEELALAEELVLVQEQELETLRGEVARLEAKAPEADQEIVQLQEQELELLREEVVRLSAKAAEADQLQSDMAQLITQHSIALQSLRVEHEEEIRNLKASSKVEDSSRLGEPPVAIANNDTDDIKLRINQLEMLLGKPEEITATITKIDRVSNVLNLIDASVAKLAQR